MHIDGLNAWTISFNPATYRGKTYGGVIGYMVKQKRRAQAKAAAMVAQARAMVPAPAPAASAYTSLAPILASQPAPIPQVTATQTAPITGAIATTAQQSANVTPVSSQNAATLVPTTGGADYMTMFEAAKKADTPSGSFTSKTETVSDNKNIIYIGVGLAALLLLAKKRK